MTEKEQNVITLELYWAHALPQFDIPGVWFLKSWLNRATVEQVILAMEETAKRAYRLASSEHASRFTASRLNVLVDRASGTRTKTDNTRVVHFDDEGQRQ